MMLQNFLLWNLMPLYIHTIEDSNKKFAIQGKDVNSINEDEVINLGFKTTINVATLYKLSVAAIRRRLFNGQPYLFNR